MLHPKLQKTVMVLYIYGLISLAAFFYFANTIIVGVTSGEPYSIKVALFMGGVGLFGLASSVFIYRVIRGLKQKKFWAWFSAIVICSFASRSLILIPLGIIGLVGLGNKEVRKEYM